MQLPGPKRRRGSGGARALGGALLAGVLSVAGASCGGSSSTSLPAGTLKLSVASGAPGTVVALRGNAGTGCVVDQNWYGFAFQRAGVTASGPLTTMATPILSDGSWTASFVVPSFLGGSAKRGPGALATAGRYEFTAPDCKGHKVAMAYFQLLNTTQAVPAYVAIATTTDGQGYWLAQSNGTITPYGDARPYGSPATGKVPLTAPIVGMARTSLGAGYWLVSSAGRVYAFGDAHNYGSLAPGIAKQAPVVGIAESPDGAGYWVLAANGHVHGFGDARLQGQPGTYLSPYNAIETRNAGGYIVTSASNGAGYLFPGGSLLGGGPGTALAATLVGTAATPSGNGAWEAGADGGVITLGDASFYGSVPSKGASLSKPVSAIAALPNGLGYWLLEGNGTVFAFGSAQVYKS